MFQAARGLDVVMGVDQRGRCALHRARLLRHDVRMGSRDLQDLDVVEARVAQDLRGALGGTHDLRRIEARSRDTGNACQIDELCNRRIEIFVDAGDHGFRCTAARSTAHDVEV